ncbi:MAG TPA: hypothetical protein PKC45_13990, partial [Gemmatales bacterium]|nr:hypothetical protein [Gemmatales bacterium]
LFTDSRARVKAHPGTVQKLLDALNKIELGSAAGFLDDEPRQRAWFGTEPVDLGLDQPQAEIAIWYEGLVRDAEGKATGEGEPKLKDDQKATPRLKFSLGRSDAKRGVVYVRREAVGAPPAILAIPDPWQGQAPPPPSFPGQPPMPTAQPAPISLTSLVGGGYLAYRERLLPSFRPDLAAKLTLKRGTDVYELAKEEKKDEQGATKAVWNVTQPVAGVSQNADVMLFSLVGLSADKLVTDRPTERDLNEKFGLGDNALLRIHVVTKPDEQQRVAQFTWLVGQATDADAKHPNHHYVRLISQPVDGSKPEANDFVFLVDRQQLLGCDQELRDPHIFPPAAARPTGATFTWRTVDAEKKLTQTQAEVGLGDDGKTWVVRSVTVDGADAKDRLPALDQAKLNMMFGMDEQGMSLALPGVPRLNNLYTERFLVHQGPPTPEQQLDPARADAPPPLQVEIKFADGSTRLLTLGARFELTQPQHVSLRGQTFFPATSSTVPQAVFTLSLADFKGLVDEGLNFLRPPGPLGSASSQ